MPLVEGVGDEIVYLFVALIFGLLIVLAWISTNVREMPYIGVVVLNRPVFQVLLRLLRSSQRNFLLHISIRPDGTTTAAVEGDSQAVAVVQSLEQVRLDEGSSEVEDFSSPDEVGGTSASPPLPLIDELAEPPSDNPSQTFEEAASSVSEIRLDDSEAAVVEQHDLSQVQSEAFAASEELQASLVRSRQLGFLERSQSQAARASCSSDTTATADASSRNTLAGGKVGQVGSNDILVGNDTAVTANENCPPRSTAAQQEDSVCIRLKYLDERQRSVLASLDETIGEFKRKHFAEELANSMAVRFIFNGQELKHDEATLRSCGLSNDSVVHCLLTAARPPAQASASMGMSDARRASRAASVEAEVVAVHQAANIGMHMLPLMAVILALLWYCRLVYRSYFSAASTLILVGMTTIFSVILLSAFQRRPAHNHVE